MFRIPLLTAVLCAGLSAPIAAQCEPEQLIFPGELFGDRMGTAVVVRDRLAVVGAEQAYVSKFVNFGYVKIYRRILGTWAQVQTLPPTNFDFGRAVDTDGTRIVVGAPGAPGFSFAEVNTYVFDGSKWVLEQSLHHPNLPPIGSPPFGASVAIRGRWLAVGHGDFGSSAPRSVYAYHFDGDTWTVDEEFTGPAEQHYGQSLALGRGVLVIGAPDDGAGRVEIHRYQNGTWQLEQSLTPPDPDLCNFGDDVALTRGLLAVSAGCEDSVLFYRRVGGSWVETDRVTLPQPSAPEDSRVRIDLDSPVAVAGVPGFTLQSTGRAYQLRLTPGGWKVEKELCQSAPATGNAIFGASVSISDHVVVGNPLHAGTGAAFFYPVTGTTQVLPVCNPGNYSAGTATLPFTLYGTGSFAPLGDIVDWQWSFSDGAVASGSTPTHVFATSGTHTVDLTVTDALGATSTCSTQLVMDDPPPCLIQGSYALLGMPITFDGTGSGTSGLTVTDWVWDFGDGAFGTGPTPTHTYLQKGNFTVSLTVLYSDGSSASCSQNVRVQAPPGSCLIAPFSIANIGVPTPFDGTASMLAGQTAVAYDWDFGDGTTGSGATTTHTYTGPGLHPVTLTVTYSAGSSVQCLSWLLVNAPPACVVTVLLPTISVDHVAAFEGDLSSDPGGTIVSYVWDFGDGTGSTGPNASHLYAAPGTYTVTLTLTDNDGATSTCTGTITVVP